MPIRSIFTQSNYFSSYIDIQAISAPSNPNSSIGRIFHNSADGKLYFKKSDGTTVDLESGGGGGGGAPTDVSYLTLSTNATLTAERVLTAGTNIAFVDAGVGSTLTVNVPNASETVKGAVELATSAETTAGLAVQASDTRLSDTRTPTDNSVTSAKIVNDSIVNADINSAAAIADSKLAQITNKGKLPNDTVYTTDTQTLENKTLDTINNTIKNIGSHNYEVYEDSGTWYARNTRTGVITSSDANLTTVLQAAIDALTGSRTWKESIKLYGAGSFGQILIPSYTRFDLTDFELTVTANTNKSVLTNTATPFHAINNPSLATAVIQIEIIGGYLDGDRTNQSDTTSADQDKNLIYLENASDCVIINPYIVNPQNDGIRLHTCTNCIVFNPYVENSRSEGLSVRDGSDNIVIGGSFKNIGWSFITSLNSPRTKFLFGYGDTNGILGATTTGVNVSSEDSIVDGWTIRNATGNGITFGDSAGAIYSPNGSVVDNCTIDSAGVNGFSCVAFAATNIKIKNSTFRNCSEYGVRPAGGDVDVFTVENCTIHDNQKAGILVNGVLSGSLIPTNGILKNNNIYNNGKGLGTDQERSGITITGDSADTVVGIIVEGNNCFDNQGTKTQKYGVRLNNTNKVQFRFNTLYDNLTDGYQLAGTNNNLENIANEGHSIENNLVGTQQANSYGAVTQTFRTGRLRIGNTANNQFATFDYSAGSSTISMNIPNLTVSDDIVFRTFAQNLTNKTLTTPIISSISNTGTVTLPTSTTTLVGRDTTDTLTNKTVNLTDNTVTDTSAAAGDLPVSNGTKYVRKGIGTSLQVLRTNSGATDIEWASLDSERTGKATETGDGTTTQFTIAHGLGAIPSYVFVDCASHAIARTFTVDGTNITIDFVSAPPNTESVIIYWRVIA